jgi:cytochrome c5
MNDSQFVKVFSGMLLALAVLTVVLIAVANSIGGKHAVAVAQADYEKVVAERTKPVGQLAVAAAVDTLIPTAQAADGKATYDSNCNACHGMGVAGAPKLGDKAAWKDRIAQGNDVLYGHAIKGFQGKNGFMPAKGGNASLADDAVKAAVDYMVSQSK